MFVDRGFLRLSVFHSTHPHCALNLIPFAGAWGISYDGGELVVLQAGRHVLDKPSHLFAGNLSAGMEVLKLRDVCSLTADNVQVRCCFAVC